MAGLALCAAILAVPALAQPGSAPAPAANAGGPPWAALTGAQQSALTPLKRDWPGIDAARKQKWLEIAARMPSLPVEDQRRIQERMAEWTRMTPEQRGKARLNFQEVRQLSPQDRQARWDAYMALPPEEREALAARSSVVPPTGRANVPAPPTTPASSNRKVNLVEAPSRPVTLAPVAPVVVQAKPGATTTLISKSPSPPPHSKPGDPKIAVPPGQVNPQTLLPQAAAGAAPAARPPSIAATRSEPAAPPASEPGR